MNQLPTGRKIGNRYLFSSGRMVTNKSAEPLEYESGLEMDFLSLLVFDNAVKSIRTQPFTIRWYDGEKWRRYTPDVLVEFVHPKDETKKLRTFVFEVKPRNELKSKWMHFKPKFKEAIKWCNEKGMTFKLITEKFIDPIYLRNIRFLMQFDGMKKHLEADKIERIESSIERRLAISGCEIQSLAKGHNIEKNYIMSFIWEMIRNGILDADLKSCLTNKSIVSLNELDNDFNFSQSPVRKAYVKNAPPNK